MTEKFQKQKFLKFLDDVYEKYPPMTFREYQIADGNHTNWFPQQCYQSTSSNYREWFTLAVLNNFNIIVRVYKQRDVEAVKIFESIINSDEFIKYIIYSGGQVYDQWWKIIRDCVNDPCYYSELDDDIKF